MATPDDEDVNSLAVTYDNPDEVLSGLITNRVELFSLIGKNESRQEVASDDHVVLPNDHVVLSSPIKEKALGQLNTHNPHRITYTGMAAKYQVLGGLGKALDSLKVTASIEPLEGGRRSRQKIDLYEDAQVEKAARKAAEKLELRADLIELDLNRLADLLEDERERKLSENTPEKPRKQILLTQAERKELSQFGKRKDLLKVLNEKNRRQWHCGRTGEQAVFICHCAESSDG